MLILHSLLAKTMSYLAESSPPTAQPLTLVLGDVFVQNDQVRTGSPLLCGK